MFKVLDQMHDDRSAVTAIAENRTQGIYLHWMLHEAPE